jgi:KDO2-lipid IV(A) lauroyltransferase
MNRVKHMLSAGVTPEVRVPRALSPSRDCREGELWSPAQSAKNAALYIAARAVLTLLSPWPARWLRAAGRGLGRVAYLLFPRERRWTHENLAFAIPALSKGERTRMARGVYVQLGDHLGDTVALLSPRQPLVPLPFEEKSKAILDDVTRQGRGVVFVSAHLGPWERVAASLVTAGVDLTVLAREGYDPRLTRLLDELRSRLGVRVIYRGSPGAPVRIVRTLRRGGVLGVPMDLRSRVPSVVAPFLGRPASTAVGPARIALRTGAGVVVGTAAPVPGGVASALSGGLQITVTRIELGDGGASALTARINDELSRRILAMPQGWVWMHPRWTP